MRNLWEGFDVDGGSWLKSGKQSHFLVENYLVQVVLDEPANFSEFRSSRRCAPITIALGFALALNADDDLIVPAVLVVVSTTGTSFLLADLVPTIAH